MASKLKSTKKLVKPGQKVIRVLGGSRVYTAPIVINVVYRVGSIKLG
jgi:hypothetical protein